MATATKPPQPAPTLTPSPLPEPPVAPRAEAPDPLRPFFGDRVAFIVWVACALFMAALLTYDTLMGLFR
jgi:hypothetical protein